MKLPRFNEVLCPQEGGAAETTWNALEQATRGERSQYRRESLGPVA